MQRITLLALLAVVGIVGCSGGNHYLLQQQTFATRATSQQSKAKAVSLLLQSGYKIDSNQNNKVSTAWRGGEGHRWLNGTKDFGNHRYITLVNWRIVVSLNTGGGEVRSECRERRIYRDYSVHPWKGCTYAMVITWLTDTTNSLSRQLSLQP